MNEVAAVTRRLIEGLLSEPDNCPVQIAKAFDGKKGIDQTRARLKDIRAQRSRILEATLTNGEISPSDSPPIRR
jgi:hypothetical protein